MISHRHYCHRPALQNNQCLFSQWTTLDHSWNTCSTFSAATKSIFVNGPKLTPSHRSEIIKELCEMERLTSFLLLGLQLQKGTYKHILMMAIDNLLHLFL